MVESRSDQEDYTSGLCIAGDAPGRSKVVTRQRIESVMPNCSDRHHGAVEEGFREEDLQARKGGVVYVAARRRVLVTCVATFSVMTRLA
jgi:hypothetical protein